MTKNLHKTHAPGGGASPLRRHVTGVTLIEVLVAIVLLGVGLLGLAGLQLRGMQMNQGSNFRSQAAILAEDLVDRMLVDPATAAAHAYDGPWQASSAATTAAGLLLADWLYRLGALPSGCAVVDTTSALPAVQITVTWDDTRAARSADPSSTAVAAAPCTTGGGNGSYVFMTALSD